MFRAVVFDALEGTRDGFLLGERIRRRPVLSCPARPRPAVPPCAAPLGPARCMSGFCIRQVWNNCAAIFLRHEGKTFNQADAWNVDDASAECADCNGLRYSTISLNFDPVHRKTYIFVVIASEENVPPGFRRMQKYICGSIFVGISKRHQALL